MGDSLPDLDEGLPSLVEPASLPTPALLLPLCDPGFEVLGGICVADEGGDVRFRLRLLRPLAGGEAFLNGRKVKFCFRFCRSDSRLASPAAMSSSCSSAAPKSVEAEGGGGGVRPDRILSMGF